MNVFTQHLLLRGRRVVSCQRTLPGCPGGPSSSPSLGMAASKPVELPGPPQPPTAAWLSAEGVTEGCCVPYRGGW